MMRSRGARPTRSARGEARSATGATSGEQIVFGDMPERGEPVAPIDLLTLGVRAAGVADRHLEDARAGVREARRDLRLEAEAIRLEPREEGARQLAAHRL